LRRTHRKLKSDIEEMQDKISDLRNKITSVQAEVAFL
jgi:peptidoglycan hydrolase CwlO-like protein